ncbi:MAG TPA: NAD(P)-dependent oxidoreductase [Candidatus Nitrosopolaris sp.]|nr:NAD(P)-dependent oxidoreductase [Candidatus Nitrosopolaris sp.]
MIIKILSYAAGLKDILSAKLEQIGLTAETVDYSQPLLPQLKDADVIVNGLGSVDRSILDASVKLKLVHQVGTGIDNVDIDYCTSKSIYVANVPNTNNVSVAEHTIFLMIYLAKNMKSADSSLMKRRVISVLGSELHGKTLLIIGLGATGMEVAKRAKAFDMHVSAITKHPSSKKKTLVRTSLNQNENVDEVVLEDMRGPECLIESIPNADYISIHTPLNNDTLGMIGTQEISLMKRSAFLINVARAAIVDGDALYVALSNRKIGGAAFDVFWDEPADPNDKLLKLDNFVLTPHLAGWTTESAEATARVIAANIERISRGETPLTTVNSMTSH